MRINSEDWVGILGLLLVAGGAGGAAGWPYAALSAGALLIAAYIIHELRVR